MLELLDFAVVIAVLVYVGGPLLIRFVTRTPKHPRLEPLGATGLEPGVLQFLNGSTDALRTVGFVPTDYVSMPNAGTNVRSYLVMLVSPATVDKAMVNAVFNNVNGTWKKVTFYVEFSTRYEDGHCVDTVNTKKLGAFRTDATDVKTRAARVQDPLELYQLHRYVMATRSPDGKKVLYRDAGPKEYLARIWIESFEKQIRYGLVYFDSRADVYRLTWRGAFLITWGQLWPISAIRRARVAAATRRVLKAMRDDIASGRWSPAAPSPVRDVEHAEIG